MPLWIPAAIQESISKKVGKVKPKFRGVTKQSGQKIGEDSGRFSWEWNGSCENGRGCIDKVHLASPIAGETFEKKRALN